MEDRFKPLHPHPSSKSANEMTANQQQRLIKPRQSIREQLRIKHKWRWLEFNSLSSLSISLTWLKSYEIDNFGVINIAIIFVYL